MSVMCKMGESCRTRRGMCGHEKIMAVMMVAVVVFALVYKFV